MSQYIFLTEDMDIIIKTTPPTELDLLSIDDGILICLRVEGPVFEIGSDGTEEEFEAQ